ncbi:MAG: alpha/beta fold hydrolase [Gammaproteobacteria bacterium]|nr:alpha/beta fold hydrolase [Gammaproteobacteria bacterium]
MLLSGAIKSLKVNTYLGRLAAIVCLLTLGFALTANAVDVEEDVIYGHKDGMALIYHVLTPEEQNGAAVLLMISGGWYSWNMSGEMMAYFTSFLTDEGFTVIAVNHGSSPRYQVPDAVSDVRRAVRHIRANADEYGIDADRMGVYGASAGGHLSLMLGLTSDEGNAEAEDPINQVSNRVNAVVAYFPPVDLKDWVNDESDYPALRFDPELAPANSPIEFVTDDDPPILLIHGDQDDVVPVEHSRRMHAALKEAGVTNEYIEIEGAGHSFSTPEHSERVNKATVDFFKEHLAPPP